MLKGFQKAVTVRLFADFRSKTQLVKAILVAYCFGLNRKWL